MERDLVTPPGLDVAVEAVVRDVERAADEPLGEREVPVEHGVEVVEPADQFARLAGPEALPVTGRLLVEGVVGHQRVAMEVLRRREGAVLQVVRLDRRFRHDNPSFAGSAGAYPGTIHSRTLKAPRPSGSVSALLSVTRLRCLSASRSPM